MINIEITEENIISIPFDEYFSENVKLTKNEIEFYGKCGKEHYRLLSYISSLFNYCNIIDLGSHRGMSALALSYNETNTIYSFDIVDNVTEQVIKDKSNIKFIHDNLWESDIQEKWKELILKSEFIFLDVDPHNGVMETIFYNYLKKINYTGFIICDDIWYFENMREIFWFKLNKRYCYDYTNLGHWSGTGIVTFNDNKYKFNKDALDKCDNLNIFRHYY
jgi:predicted O-methyltransferase YrrM